MTMDTDPQVLQAMRVMSAENQYLDLCREILAFGTDHPNRTGVNARKVFGGQIKAKLGNSFFPLLTTKFVPFKLIVAELIWFIQGRTDVQYLHDHGCKIWDEWVKPDGTIGPGYGHQWRHFGQRKVQHGGEPAIVEPGVDQLKDVVERIKSNPDCRRLVVSAWNPVDLPEMALPPCHMFFQFDVTGRTLNCQMYQRSADMFLGVPFNISSYALLTMLVAHCTDLEPGVFIHTFGNAHIYHNHFDQVRTQIAREMYPPPRIWINPDKRDLFSFEPDDIKLVNYQHHPALKGAVAV